LVFIFEKAVQYFSDLSNGGTGSFRPTKNDKIRTVAIAMSLKDIIDTNVFFFIVFSTVVLVLKTDKRWLVFIKIADSV